MDGETFAISQRKERLLAFVRECLRVLRITRKPDRIEFLTIVKISALGIAAIGALGFAIQMTKHLLFG